MATRTSSPWQTVQLEKYPGANGSTQTGLFRYSEIILDRFAQLSGFRMQRDYRCQGNAPVPAQLVYRASAQILFAAIPLSDAAAVPGKVKEYLRSSHVNKPNRSASGLPTIVRDAFQHGPG